MPRRALAAALLAALALAAPACKPSSLTPFGIGERTPDQGGGSYSGLWQGVTSTGGEFSFSVGSGEVTGLTLVHATATCSRRFVSGANRALVGEDGAFSLEVVLTPAGRIVVDGIFSSPAAVAGSYFFEGLAFSPACPTAASGNFVAAKVR